MLVPIYPERLGLFSQAPVTYPMLSTDRKIGVKHASAQAGSLTDVVLYVGAIIGTAPTYRVRLETLDSLGLPSGTIFSAGAEATFTPSTTGWQAVTLGTPATVAFDDRFAVVLEYASGTVDASNFVYFGQRSNIGFGPVIYPGALQHPSTTWSLLSYHGHLHPRFSDGSYLNTVTSPGDVAYTQYFSNTDSPDEYGNRFVLPVDCIVKAVQFYARIVHTTCTGTIKLYDESDTLLASTDLDITVMTTTNFGFVTLPIGPVSLSAGDVVRCSFLATSTHDIVLHTLNYYSAAAANEWHCSGDGAVKLTTRSSGGSWTDNDTSILKLNLLGEISSGGGGGGGGVVYHPRGQMTGGFA